MRKSIVIALILIIHATLYGQNALYKGTVIDAEYHTPVAYAAVFIQNTSYGSVADNVGKFSFTAPDSLKNVRFVIARQEFKIKYLPLDNQISTDLIIALQPDNIEQRAPALLDNLAGGKRNLIALLNKATIFVINDWIPLGEPESNKFDFGRIQTFPTYNPIEGLRLRAGVASNSRLSSHLFLKGYVAYGFGDQQFKYRGEAIYSFDRKAYHENEFPKNNLNLVYEKDLYSPGEIHPRSLNDLLLITYRRSENESTYRNFAEINYEREYKNGLAHTIWVRRARMVPQEGLRFENQIGDMILVDDALHTAEAGLLLRYSLREAYLQKKRVRKPLEDDQSCFLSFPYGWNV